MKRSLLTRDARGVRTSKTGRGSAFSKWHRGLKRNCYMCDVDALEYRFENGELKLKAVIEEKRWDLISTDYIINSQTKALHRLSQAAGVKFFYIWPYDIGPHFFRLWDVTESGVRKDFLKCCKYVSEKHLKNVIEGL